MEKRVALRRNVASLACFFSSFKHVRDVTHFGPSACDPSIATPGYDFRKGQEQVSRYVARAAATNAAIRLLRRSKNVN
jgi:hypothetical protein